ncbi:Peroxisomal membrane protein pex16 [Coelomomyces lativittatus]|nr:Peroxisomal membrane protein pex16 [Coelomomyces lativittatus]KAJ1514048.1 Peroxisomal membrane protein pex16 [Coelomomyces lativittatus]KAJ1514908.1 Peroxisomal membrane protein pex16 [Coelomomyces lativittatus]
MKFNVCNAYRQFVLKNTSQISLIESTLRSISYLLPSSFSDAHFTSETLYVLVNTVSLYHDSILYQAYKNGEIAPTTLPTKNVLNQYLRSIHDQSPLLYYFNLCLTLLQSSEYVMEWLILSKRSDPNQKNKRKERPWTFILLIELIKASIRTHFVLTTKGLSLTPSLPERDLDPNSITSSPYQGRRTGLMFTTQVDSTLTSSTSKTTMASCAIPLTSLKHVFTSPRHLVTKLKNQRMVGELVFIFRPVIYVTLMKKYGQQRWFPFVTSLILEFFSYFLCTQVHPTPLERREYQRRTHLFFLYFLRPPFYDKLTKPVLDKLLSSLDTKPILRSAAKLVRDYQPFWEKMYFHTSGS